jgi:hypothetical protein
MCLLKTNTQKRIFGRLCEALGIGLIVVGIPDMLNNWFYFVLGMAVTFIGTWYYEKSPKDK